MEIDRTGIKRKYDFPRHMNTIEKDLMDLAFLKIQYSVSLATGWFTKCRAGEMARQRSMSKRDFLERQSYRHLEECAVHLT